MKKIMFAVGLSFGLLLLAGQALAASYAPGAAPTSAQQWQSYITGLQQGTLSAQDQKAMYQEMQSMRSTVTVSGGAGIMRTSAMPVGSGNMMYSAMPSTIMLTTNPEQAWFGIMATLTIALIWVVLLLLIGLLWQLLKKHKHG